MNLSPSDKAYLESLNPGHNKFMDFAAVPKKFFWFMSLGVLLLLLSLGDLGEKRVWGNRFLGVAILIFFGSIVCWIARMAAVDQKRAYQYNLRVWQDWKAKQAASKYPEPETFEELLDIDSLIAKKPIATHTPTYRKSMSIAGDKTWGLKCPVKAVDVLTRQEHDRLMKIMDESSWAYVNDRRINDAIGAEDSPTIQEFMKVRHPGRKFVNPEY